MTAHAHRTPIHPFDQEARRRGGRALAREAVGHAPEVLLALAAVLVVLAGPVARTFAPHNVWVAAGSSVLLVVGIVLAVIASRHLLRAPAD